ncbi:sigma 54-interacting transcriptional regulator [Oceanobacillus damuensis]|uniref:sigma 54-interacting transcriptional regulator n=1 Tax=Oceanobacillus damuensis TaxID=937928 RepID=UPI000830373F|nr:sigma 54-interacting transcriptional regulator [Oceanobacillus damuensis]
MNNLYLLPNAEEEIIDSYDEDIIVTNRDGKIIKSTHISGKQYGLSAADLLGKSVYDLEAKGIFSPAITPLVQAQKKKVVIVQTKQDGGKVLITGVPLFNEHHEVEFVVSYSYDVSELLVLQEYLNELEGEVFRVKEELETLREKSLTFDGIVAESKSMKDVLKSVNKVAPLKVPVHLQGENGVGKSTLAKLVHKQGPWKTGPFIEVNCAAIPETLLERELLGSNVKGLEKAGYFQLAQSGTLYLQGVDELSRTSQNILLKALRQNKNNFRIISSTENNMEKLVAANQFMEDLFFHLHVIPISIKPLRERPEDLSVIILNYVEKYCGEFQLERTLSNELFQELLTLEWKGNHHEVKNVMERLVAESESDIITIDDLPMNYRSKDETELVPLEMEGKTLTAILESVEEKVLIHAKKQCKTTTEMAKILGISQPSVVRKLKKYSM